MSQQLMIDLISIVVFFFIWFFISMACWFQLVAYVAAKYRVTEEAVRLYLSERRKLTLSIFNTSARGNAEKYFTLVAKSGNTTDPTIGLVICYSASIFFAVLFISGLVSGIQEQAPVRALLYVIPLILMIVWLIYIHISSYRLKKLNAKFKKGIPHENA